MNVEWCAKHQAYRPAGDPCPQCAAPQEASGLRAVVNTLKGFVDDQGQQIQELIKQVDDQGAYITQLRMRVTELEHERNARVEVRP